MDSLISSRSYSEADTPMDITKTHEYHVMLVIMIGFAFISAFCSVVLPFLYLFSPRTDLKQPMAKIVLFHYSAIAGALCGTVLFTLWKTPPLFLAAAVQGTVFLCLSISSILLISRIWYYNYSNSSSRPRTDETINDS